MKHLRLLIAFIFAFLNPFFLNAESQVASKLIDGQKQTYLTNQVIVKVKAGARGKSQADARFGANRIGSMAELGLQILRVPAEMTQEQYIDQLKALDYIEFAEPNFVIKANLTPNDFIYFNQTNLEIIGMPNAWDITSGVSSIVVAVIDTGLALTHPDISANLWVNPSPSGTSGLNGTRTEIDWDGNGDCLGTDAFAGPEMCASSNPTDDNTGTFHGTHVSGIIAATTNNGIDMAGVAFGARIMAVKVLNSAGFGSASSIANGILYAVNNGAKIINLSLGSPSESSAITTAVNYAMAREVVVVAAAGNDGNASPVNYPAATTNVIAVGATNDADQLASFSCTGSQIDVVAPGVLIHSLTSPSGTSQLSGTSFSAPQVAGVAALLRSLDPNMTIKNLRNYINFNAHDLGTTGFDTSFGYGRLNAYATLNSANNGDDLTSNPLDANATYVSPSPYNPTTDGSMEIWLPQNLGSNSIKIEIFTLSGEKVKTLDETRFWDGKNKDGNFAGSGIYFYTAETSAGATTGKFTLVK